METTHATPNNKPIAVVTGASGGMGVCIVEKLARTHHVYALGRNVEKLAALPAEPIAADLVSVLLDGESNTGVQQLLGLKQVDVLVHAAAIADPLSVESATPQQWRAQMDLNVGVPAELTRSLLPALRKAQGTVIFINSGAGQGAYPDNVVYAASKHALRALADGLRKGESHRGVRVSTVAPGPTDTPMLQGLIPEQAYDPTHYIDPEEVAVAVRLVVDAGPTTQFTEVAVRPRIELVDRRD